MRKKLFFAIVCTAQFIGCVQKPVEDNEVSIKSGGEASQRIQNSSVVLGRVIAKKDDPNFGKFYLICSGSIIRKTDRHFDVLTANHCGGSEIESLIAIHSPKVKSTVSMKRVHKIEKIAEPSLASRELFPDKKGVIHKKTNLADIMILRFSGQLDSSATPAVLAKKDPLLLTVATFAGYGETGGFNNDTGTLNSVVVPVGFSRKGAIYRVLTSDRGSCRYDSGGPMFQSHAVGAQKLIGVISNGVYVDRQCFGLNQISSIIPFLDWISATDVDSSLWREAARPEK